MRYKFNLAKKFTFVENEELVIIKIVTAHSLEEALKGGGEYQTIPIKKREGESYESKIQDLLKQKKESIELDPPPFVLGEWGPSKFYDMESSTPVDLYDDDF